MLIRTGVENNMDGHSLAWALEHPGCFANGADGEAALAALPAAWRLYTAWIGAHTAKSWLPDEPAEIRLEETWEGYTINEQFERAEDGYDVDAWFLHDWKPLTQPEIERGLLILSWCRADLLAVVAGLSNEKLEHAYPGERWSITGILKHIGGAEWWYLDRLGLAFPRGKRARAALQTPGAGTCSPLPGAAGAGWLNSGDWHRRRVLVAAQTPPPRRLARAGPYRAYP